MDDDYYGYTIENSEQIEESKLLIRRAVCLKAKAFLDLSERRAKGYIQLIRRMLTSTRKMSSRLVAMLAPSERFTLYTRKISPLSAKS